MTSLQYIISLIDSHDNGQSIDQLLNTILSSVDSNHHKLIKSIIESEKFSKSILFNFNIKSIHQELIDYSDLILFKNICNPKKCLDQYCRLLRLIVANLYNSYSYRLYLRVNHNSNYYGKKSSKYSSIIPQNQDLFSYTIINNIFSALKEHDLVYTRPGFYSLKSSRITRYYPKGELLELFRYVRGEIQSPEDSVIARNIKQNGKKGEIIDDIIKNVSFPEKYKQDKVNRLNLIRSQVDTINDYLNRAEIVVNNPSKAQGIIYTAFLYTKRRFLQKLDYQNYLMLDECKRFKRIFNDANIEKGGRIYAPFQQYSSDTRRRFLINQENVALLDIASSHIKMLYHISNLDFKGDAYEALFKDTDAKTRKEILRKINKKVLQALINAKTEDSVRRSAFQSILAVLKEYGRYDVAKNFTSHIHAQKWIDEFKKKHSAIKHYFHSGKGIELQYVESELVIQAMLLLIEQDIPSLSVHDELIVPYSKKEVAQGIMEDLYRNMKIFNGHKVTIGLK